MWNVLISESLYSRKLGIAMETRIGWNKAQWSKKRPLDTTPHMRHHRSVRDSGCHCRVTGVYASLQYGDFESFGVLQSPWKERKGTEVRRQSHRGHEELEAQLSSQRAQGYWHCICHITTMINISNSAGNLNNCF